ncbi:MAG: hypothetical protein U5J96_04035 [Ignavibacteriaceae bacterium]|nr:hypothetical protein [Ignavibacteriaceae bacterium]
MFFQFVKTNKAFLSVSTYEAGLNKLDRESNRFERIIHDPNNPNSLSDNSISLIFNDSFGDLSIGTKKSGMDRLEKGAREFIHYGVDPENPSSVSSKLVYCF